jgi:hypothetical protein
MRNYKPLVDLQRRIQQKEQGCLSANNISVCYKGGKLLLAESNDDLIWILRRMVVLRYLTKDEAYTLMRIPVLDGRFFPEIPVSVYTKLVLERAKQNLFRWSYVSSKPQYSAIGSIDSPLFHENPQDLLAQIWVYREKLSKWYNDVKDKWIYCEDGYDEIAILCRKPILLRRLILQSPLEEVHTLEKINRLNELLKLRVGDSIGEVLGYEETQEETDLFQDYDVYRGGGEGIFQVHQSMIEQIELSSELSSPWTSKEAFFRFINELNTLFSQDDKCNHDEKMHSFLQEYNWPVNSFEGGQWNSETLWRRNCIQKEVFVELLMQWIKINHMERYLPQIDIWISKWA